MKKTIEDWIDENIVKLYLQEDTATEYTKGKYDALVDLKSKIPDLIEKIDNIRQTDREKVVENITQGLTTMKIGGQEGYIPNDIAKRLNIK